MDRQLYLEKLLKAYEEKQLAKFVEELKLLKKPDFYINPFELAMKTASPSERYNWKAVMRIASSVPNAFGNLQTCKDKTHFWTISLVYHVLNPSLNKINTKLDCIYYSTLDGLASFLSASISGLPRAVLPRFEIAQVILSNLKNSHVEMLLELVEKYLLQENSSPSELLTDINRLVVKENAEKSLETYEFFRNLLNRPSFIETLLSRGEKIALIEIPNVLEVLDSKTINAVINSDKVAPTSKASLVGRLNDIENHKYKLYVLKLFLKKPQLHHFSFKPQDLPDDLVKQLTIKELEMLGKYVKLWINKPKFKLNYSLLKERLVASLISNPDKMKPIIDAIDWLDKVNREPNKLTLRKLVSEGRSMLQTAGSMSNIKTYKYFNHEAEAEPGIVKLIKGVMSKENWTEDEKVLVLYTMLVSERMFYEGDYGYELNLKDYLSNEGVRKLRALLEREVETYNP